MKTKNLSELDYNLELERIVKEIKKKKAKKILLQFPDGLKPYSTQVKDKIQNLLGNYDCDIFIWLDSCFGACDIPLETEKLGIDLIIQFGHSEFIKEF